MRSPSQTLLEGRCGTLQCHRPQRTGPRMSQADLSARRGPQVPQQQCEDENQLPAQATDGGRKKPHLKLINESWFSHGFVPNPPRTRQGSGIRCQGRDAESFKEDLERSAHGCSERDTKFKIIVTLQKLRRHRAQPPDQDGFAVWRQR